MNSNVSVDSISVMLGYSDFVKSEYPSERIILIDYLTIDSSFILNITESLNVFEVFYRKPDFYFIDERQNNIVYIHTQHYSEAKDTLTLARLFDETQKTLYYNDEWILRKFNSTGETIRYESLKKHVNWKNDSIKCSECIPMYAIAMSFEPIPIQYTIINNKIINKQFVEKVIYPDISKPKGTSDSRYRMLPYWRE